jgi:hypothetical protein
MAMLTPLGIEKGKPFQPDARQAQILTDAPATGEAMARAMVFDSRYEGIRYRPDAHLENGVPARVRRGAGRGELHPARPAGQARVRGLRDVRQPGQHHAGHRPGLPRRLPRQDGEALDGGKAHRLRIPANPPAKLFWSVTLYEAATRTPLRNEQRIADRSSRQDLVANADGSVDSYTGPKPPTGSENNWIPTEPGRAWFSYIRLYGPLEAYFDQSWPLPDFEQQPE